MSGSPARRAVFDGLVFNEEGEPAEVSWVGGEPCYVILDAGFRRYAEAETIDRQVLVWLHEQISSNQELVTQGTMSLLGKDDLFTKAMIDASLKDMEKQIEQLTRQGLPEGARTWLGMLGFRVVVNVHGEVMAIEAPGAIDEGDW
jgi:hypothetical protein